MAPKAPAPKDDAPASDSEEEEFKFIVRIANTDIDGNRTLVYGLSEIKGVGYRLAFNIIEKTDFPRNKKMGDLTDEEIEHLAAAVENISEDFPIWMLNRQADYETGKDLHLIGTDLTMTKRDDFNRLKKIRCYRGIRHENGHKVRGQRTRSNGRSGLSLGVSRKRK